MDYYQRPEVSNSDLTALKYEIAGVELPDMTEVFAFGNLVDAMLTEPHRVNTWARTLDGQPAADFDRAVRMVKMAKADPNFNKLLANAQFQHVSLKQLDFDWNGYKFTLAARCKWDFYGHISGDIKTTAATTQKQFIDACHHFDYFRGRAWYMDVGGTNRDVLIGISKTNFKIFYITIQRGDDLYNAGRAGYTDLALKWHVLKQK